MSEFWITQDEIIYCDGDAGFNVPSHEDVVQAVCCQQVCDALESSGSPELEYLADCLKPTAYGEDPYAVDVYGVSRLMDVAVAYLNNQGRLSGADANDIVSVVSQVCNLDRWVVASGLGCGEYDLRDKALTQWDWIRVVVSVKQVFIQLGSLTSANLKRAYTHIYNELEDEADVKSWTVEWEGGCVFGVNAQLIRNGAAARLISRVRTTTN